MITLRRDTLSFSFPGIAKQIRVLVERRIQEIASELPPSWDRADLWAEVESSRYFGQLSAEAQEAAHAKVHTFTPAHVEAYLRKLYLNLNGLETDSFAALTIRLQRAMRIPNDGETYTPPTSLGQLPLRSIDDFAETAPASWMKKGGVVMPLHRSDAIWIWLSSRSYFAVKVAAGKVNALSGQPWKPGLQREPQNYLLVPDPPGYEDEEVVRRLIAMPLRSLVSSTELPRGEAGDTGILFEVTPMRAERYYRHEGAFLLPPTIKEFFMKLIFAPIISARWDEVTRRSDEGNPWSRVEKSVEPILEETSRRETIEDPYELAEWDETQTVRCVVQPCEDSVWRQITGTNAPHGPLTSAEYEEADIPWCDDSLHDVKSLPAKPSRILQSESKRRRGEIREFLENP